MNNAVFLSQVQVFVCVLVFFISSACPDDALAAGERVTIKSLVGKVSAVSPDSTATRTVRIGMRVPIGWHVKTEKESWVELVFESGTVLRLGENSIVTLSEKSSDFKDSK